MDHEASLQNPLNPADFWRGAALLFRSPKKAFQSLPKEGGYSDPILYALVWQFIAGAVTLVVTLFRPGTMPWGTAGKILSFFVGPPLAILAGFVISGFFFVVWHLMGSSQRYQTAFRVWALLMPLAAVSAVLRLLPVLNLLVVAYYVYLLVVASTEVHGLRPTMAWTVWSALLVLFLAAQIVAQVIGAMRARLLSGRTGPQSSAPILPGQAITAEDLRKKVEEDLAKSKAQVERMKKKSPSTPAAADSQNRPPNR